MVLLLSLAGCGTPGPPQPPSLHLPGPVTDLAAVRTGDHVALTWTMPKRTTDRVALKDGIAVHVCRKVKPDACDAVAALKLLPGADGSYNDTLPATLASGEPRPLSYQIELLNRSGRSAGPSNAAEVLAGTAPAAVADLAAEVRKSGVVLHWAPQQHAGESVRLERTLLDPPERPKHTQALAGPAEPVQQTLLVHDDEGRALDQSITFGRTYQYRAQRVAQVAVGGKALELDGPLSAPIKIEAADVFPPAVPTGLAAVATQGENGAPPAIDLSWEPVSDADIAGYVVYRREDNTPWRRISPTTPVVGPAFHDADVQPGHTYRYGVSAVDQLGHESTRSADAEETVPAN